MFQNRLFLFFSPSISCPFPKCRLNLARSGQDLLHALPDFTFLMTMTCFHLFSFINEPAVIGAAGSYFLFLAVGNTAAATSLCLY